MLKRFLSFIILLLLTAGCAGNQTGQTTATPGTSPTAPPTPVPATATIQVVPPESFPVIRIKNAETGMYLYEESGQAKLGDISDDSSLWLMEDYQGAKRFQNKASGNYLSIENLKPYVEVITIYPAWMSPRWVLDADPSQGSVAIRNVWHNWQVLYVEDGQVKYEKVPTTEDNARWIIEPAEGGALAVNTPIPVFEIPPATNPVGSRGADVPWIE